MWDCEDNLLKKMHCLYLLLNRKSGFQRVTREEKLRNMMNYQRLEEEMQLYLLRKDTLE